MQRQCSFAVVLAGVFLAGSGHAAELAAGVARAELTPPMEMKAALGGYGARMSRPAEGVHDPVLVKALVISDGSRRFAVLTADILGFPPAFKPALVTRLAGSGWTPSRSCCYPATRIPASK